MPSATGDTSVLCVTCYDKWIEKGKPMKANKPAIKYEMKFRSLPPHCLNMNAAPTEKDRKVKYPHPPGNVSTSQLTEKTYYYLKDFWTGLKQTKSQRSFSFSVKSSTAKSKPKAVKTSKFANKPIEKKKQVKHNNTLIEALYGIDIWIYLLTSEQVSFSRVCTIVYKRFRKHFCNIPMNAKIVNLIKFFEQINDNNNDTSNIYTLQELHFMALTIPELDKIQQSSHVNLIWNDKSN